jgi:hypothetical protein
MTCNTVTWARAVKNNKYLLRQNRSIEPAKRSIQDTVRPGTDGNIHVHCRDEIDGCQSAQTQAEWTRRLGDGGPVLPGLPADCSSPIFLHTDQIPSSTHSCYLRPITATVTPPDIRWAFLPCPRYRSAKCIADPERILTFSPDVNCGCRII